ncbi:hypothetical protein FHR71_000730 [Methylobacterium sp. RAS18]|nr:hypothetical protein [Methylobacterium sp. RAS18]
MTNDDRPCRDRRVLTHQGLRWRGLRFGSLALASLRRRLGPGAHAYIRIDPTDPTCAHVLDEGCGTWIRADLLPPFASDAG